MKKIIILLLIFVFPIIVLAYKPGDTYIKGDANNDGKVTSTDYIIVRKHILKQTKLSGDAFTRADVTGDNKITSLDYIAIRKMILNGQTNEKITVPGATTKPTNTPKPTTPPTIVNPTNLNLSYDKKTGIYDTCYVSGNFYECNNYLNVVVSSTNATTIHYTIMKKNNGSFNKVSENTISGTKATIKLSGDGEYQVKAYPLNSNSQKGTELSQIYTVLTDQYQHKVYIKDGIEIRIGLKGKTSFVEPNKNFTYYFKVKGKKLNNTKVTNTITSKTSGLNISKTDSNWNNKTLSITDDNEHLYTGTFNVSKNGVYTISININGIVNKFDIGVMPKNKKASSTFYYGVSPYLNRVGWGDKYRVTDQGVEKSIASLMETAKYMGINVIREDTGWNTIQKNINNDSYSFSMSDKLNSIISKYGFKWLWTLGNKRSDVKYYESQYLSKYQSFIKTVASRYAKDNNIIWEIWNEPDLIEFFCYYENSDTCKKNYGNKNQYLAMLKTAASEIKKINSKATVSAGGLAVYYKPANDSIANMRAWKGETIFPDYKKLIDNGSINTFAIHNHKEWNNGTNGFIISMNDFTDSVNNNSLAYKGVFVTESGTAEGENQAYGLADKVLWYRSHGYKLFMQFSMLDYDESTIAGWNKAIFNRYLEPRDAAITYSTVIRFLGQAKLTNGIYGDKNGSLYATIYYDETNNTSIIPVFSITDNGKSITIPSGAKVYDMYGNIKTVPNNTIKATTKPVYVVISGKVTKDKFKVS